MTLLIVLFVLWLRHEGKLAEPADIVASLTRRWRDFWLHKSTQEGWSWQIAVFFVVAPPVALVLVLAIACYGVTYGLWNSLLSLFVLLLVLLDHPRPEALEREQQAWIAADEQHAAFFSQADPLLMQRAAYDELSRARRELLQEQLRVLFSPLFWFLLLGPAAALAYYFLRLLQESPSNRSDFVSRIMHYADWPVARVLALCFALAGNFSATWLHWREQAAVRDVDSLAFLEESATHAQPFQEMELGDRQPGAFLGQSLQSVVSLLQRVLVIWLVFLALHTLWP